MADWKSALKDIKRQLPSSSKDTQSSKPKPHFSTHQQVSVTVKKQNSSSSESIQVKRHTRPTPSPKFPKLSPHVNAAKCANAQPIKAQAKQPATARPSHANPEKGDTTKVQTAPVVQKPVPLPVPLQLKAQQCTTLARQQFFKRPDDWVTHGSKCQLTEENGKARYIDVVIGLDFGTSYTKAAVGLLDRIHPVSWKGVSSLPDEFLLPSEYTICSDGIPVLGQCPETGAPGLKRDLKIPFVHPGVSTSSTATASIFLALVLRYIRAWVFEYHAGKIGMAKIRWQLNLGAPSNGLEDDRLKYAYRRLACAAWTLSEKPLESLCENANELVQAWQDGQKPESLNDFSVFPEFVAQIAGYVQSPQRTAGLHALVDVGCGTMDVVTFIVHRLDEDDVFPFLVPSVKWLGTQMLNQNRVVGLQNVDHLILPDELSPTLTAQSYATATGVPEVHVRQRDVMMFDTVHKVVAGVFATTKTRRYRLSNAWSHGLRTFLTGGGAQAEGYSDAVNYGATRIAKRIDLMQLPFHPRLADFAKDLTHYQRISVACGLAQDAFSLGRIVPAKDVEDDCAVIFKAAERPDRDDLYPH